MENRMTTVQFLILILIIVAIYASFLKYVVIPYDDVASNTRELWDNRHVEYVKFKQCMKKESK